MLARLPEGTKAPSVSWIKLNFSPSNRYNTAANNYTGKFNIRFALQQRLVRVQHPDAHFCSDLFGSDLFGYVKEFACCCVLLFYAVSATMAI